MRRRTPHGMVLVTFVAIVVANAACGDQSDEALEAKRVFAAASPTGSGTCWAGSAQRTAQAFETSCELVLGTDWIEYKRWLRSRMEPRYNAHTESNESIAFSRALDGDLYTVNVALTNNSAAKSVRITFRAAPW